MKKKIKQKPNILQEAYHSLLTSQEEEIQQISLEYFPIQTSKVKKVLKEDEEIIIDEDEVPDIELTTIDLEALKKENKADRIAEIAHLLILKKKINPDNAFEMPIFNIKEMSDFQNFSDWKKLSFALESGAHIYGHRVDFLHNNAFRIQGNLLRSDLEPEKSLVQTKAHQNSKSLIIIKGIESKRDDKFIEKNLASLDAVKYDLEFDIDPLFHKTSAKFDESAAKGLLLNNLFVNRHLKIDFSSFREDFSSDIIEEHFQEKTLIKYENFNDLKINCIVSTQELKNLEICNKMEHILQHMRMQIEHIDKYELIKDEEVNEEELFEDSFHLNQIVDVSNQSLLGNDNSKKILPPKHHKKKHFEKSLIFEDLEERNHKIGIGRVRRGLFLKNEEYVSNNKKKKGKGINKSRAKEISRNSLKRSRRRNTTVLSISFNMEVEEDRCFYCLSKPKRKIYLNNEDFSRELYLTCMNQNLKVENFKECYIRDFSSVIRNQKNEVANWKNNRKKKAGIDENENEEEKKTNEGAATDNYKIEEAEVPNATSINYSKKIKEKKRETFQTYLSIKELKNQMNEYIKNYYEQKNHEKLTFYNIMKTIHEKLSSAQRSIVNIQICFLSLLHLSAEQSFTLKPTPLDPNNFFIFLKENL